MELHFIDTHYPTGSNPGKGDGSGCCGIHHYCSWLAWSCHCAEYRCEMNIIVTNSDTS